MSVAPAGAAEWRRDAWGSGAETDLPAVARSAESVRFKSLLSGRSRFRNEDPRLGRQLSGLEHLPR